MVVRNIRASRKAVTTEDAFGTPPAARGSMMNVAGKTDDDVDLPLITDDDEIVEGSTFVTIAELRRLIRSRLT